ncbi:MAG: serine hydrolase [Bacteroidota bacterium]
MKFRKHMTSFKYSLDFSQLLRPTWTLLFVIVGFSISGWSQRADSPVLTSILEKASAGPAQQVLKDPDTYRLQIIYTQIDRNKKGEPSFTHHTFRVDPNKYFNPASMVKMPLAFLALEKLHQLSNPRKNEPGVPALNRDTRIAFDSSYPRQVIMLKDGSAPGEIPTIGHLVKRAFLISENDPYNRFYQFMGQGPTNQILQTKGYSSVRITRQFMGFTDEQNRHTNAVRFYNPNGQEIYSQEPGYNRDSFSFPAPILIGNAHINRQEQLVQGPFDFTRHNSISLADMQKMLQAVVFPNSLPKQNRFDISEQDRLFLLQYLSQYPSETNYPKYDTSVFYDSYVKFFFQDSTHRMPPGVRVFNKVGWAYGFLTDVSYVVDTINRVDYFLSATLYVNSDGVVNDSKYDEGTVGFPFLRELGRLVYNYELTRNRSFRPPLNIQGIRYEKRDPADNRPTIKEADN